MVFLPKKAEKPVIAAIAIGTVLMVIRKYKDFKRWLTTGLTKKKRSKWRILW